MVHLHSDGFVIYSSFFAAASFFSLEFLSCPFLFFFFVFLLFFLSSLQPGVSSFALFCFFFKHREKNRFLAKKLDFGKTTGIKEHKDDSRTLF